MGIGQREEKGGTIILVGAVLRCPRNGRVPSEEEIIIGENDGHRRSLSIAVRVEGGLVETVSDRFIDETLSLIHLSVEFIQFQLLFRFEQRTAGKA